MTINQLEYFIAIAEHESFLDASEALHLSQSSLSKSIQRLEQELDVKLLDRSRRKSSMTPEGAVFYAGAKNILAAYDQAMTQLTHTKNQLHGKIRLVTLPILSQYHITPKLRVFTAEHPDIELEIDEMEDRTIMHELNENTCDLAIAREELLSGTDHPYYSLAEDHLVAVLPRSHPLATQEIIDLRDLAAEKFIFMNRHISVYQTSLNACRDSGFMPDVIRTARIESILSAVQAKEGISLLMKGNTEIFHHQDLTFIPLQRPVLSRVVAAIPRQKTPDKKIKALLKTLKD